VSLSSSVRVLACGPFGRDVAGHLGALAGPGRVAVRRARSPLSPGLPAFLEEGSLGILATYRDIDADLEAFASAAASAGLPWLPVALSPGHVRVGPLTVPGAVPCPACYAARRAQHGWISGGWERALEQDHDLGIHGFAPHLAAMAAGLALAIAGPAEWPGRPRPDGALYLIDPARDAVSSWHVIPVHGCEACEPAVRRAGSAAAGLERLRAAAGPIAVTAPRPGVTS